MWKVFLLKQLSLFIEEFQVLIILILILASYFHYCWTAEKLCGISFHFFFGYNHFLFLHLCLCIQQHTLLSLLLLLLLHHCCCCCCSGTKLSPEAVCFGKANTTGDLHEVCGDVNCRTHDLYAFLFFYGSYFHISHKCPVLELMEVLLQT